MTKKIKCDDNQENIPLMLASCTRINTESQVSSGKEEIEFAIVMVGRQC